MHEMREEKEACMQCRKRKEHTCSEERYKSLHAEKAEK